MLVKIQDQDLAFLKIGHLPSSQVPRVRKRADFSVESSPARQNSSSLDQQQQQQQQQQAHSGSAVSGGGGAKPALARIQSDVRMGASLPRLNVPANRRSSSLSSHGFSGASVSAAARAFRDKP